eukprot:GHRQ01007341.1.p1 GENE.GHRQ01007341.1~~GHRQ01007341.1.p1  ORF type:complete len:157 (-),score=3.05 GHRQ01007341.1:592-1062(-)
MQATAATAQTCPASKDCLLAPAANNQTAPVLHTVPLATSESLLSGVTDTTACGGRLLFGHDSNNDKRAPAAAAGSHNPALHEQLLLPSVCMVGIASPCCGCKPSHSHSLPQVMTFSSVQVWMQSINSCCTHCCCPPFDHELYAVVQVCHELGEHLR